MNEEIIFIHKRYKIMSMTNPTPTDSMYHIQFFESQMISRRRLQTVSSDALNDFHQLKRREKKHDLM